MPVFWPGEFHGLYSPWGGKELDTTEQLSLSLWTVKFSYVHWPNHRIKSETESEMYVVLFETLNII